MLGANQIAANQLQPHLRPGIGRDLSVDDTILVVEDEAFVREATCDILEGEGYRVLRACNAAEAQAALRRHPGSVQLLLSDIVLPGQNGPALARELRVALPSIKVILISGFPLNTVAQSGLAAGQMAFLPKPFSAESLLGKVREVLQSEEPVVSPGGCGPIAK